MSKRKLWSVTFDVIPGSRRRFESKLAVYRRVDFEREHWRRGVLRSPRLTVWVDERDGKGWQVYERIDLRDAA